MQIPPDRLSSEALAGLLEEFINREGTDYGAKEYTLDDKKKHVLRQIDRGSVVIAFDEESQSCNVLTLEQYKDGQNADMLKRENENAEQEEYQRKHYMDEE